MAKELTFQASTLPFDELIRCLNNGYYLNTFEFGSVKAVDIPWPTVATIKNEYSYAIADHQQSPDIDPNKLDKKVCKISEKKEIKSLGGTKKPWGCTSKYQVGCRRNFLIDDSIARQILDRPLIVSEKFHDKKFKIPEKEIRSLGATRQAGSYTSKNQVGCRSSLVKDDESGVKRVLEKIQGSDLPLNHSCTALYKTSSKKRDLIRQTINRKKVGIDSSTVIKSGTVSSKIHTMKVSSVLGCPTNKDEEEKKLECSGRKIKTQYEDIASEKKRRRIQVIEHQKDLFTDQQQTAKKAKKAPTTKQQIKRKSYMFVRGQKLDSQMFV